MINKERKYFPYISGDNILMNFYELISFIKYGKTSSF